MISDPLQRAQARVDALLRPIAGGDPVGVDARDDPRVQWITDEMLKDELLRRDWIGLEERAAGVLQHMCKDLRIAAIWAAAEFERDGLDGLCAGFLLIVGVLSGFGDSFFPLRARARDSALANLYEHVTLRLPVRVTPETTSAATVLATCAALDRLQAAAEARIAAPPSAKALRARLDELRGIVAPATSAPVKEPARAPSAAKAPHRAPLPEDQGTGQGSAPKVSDKDKADAGKGGADAGDPADQDDLSRQLAALTRSLPKTAAQLRRRDVGDPLAYRLLRVAVWLRASSPSPGPEGRTTIEALPSGERARLDAMQRSGRHAPLIDAAEDLLATPNGRFCLDLQRYSAEALLGLGHHDARTAIVAAIAALLRRVPGLSAMLARDGTPLADDQTRAWIATLGLGAAPQANGALDLAVTPPLSVIPPNLSLRASISSSIGQAADLAIDRDPARTRARSGDVSGAVALLQGCIEAATTPRERFRARSALAEHCLEFGLLPVARALFAALIDEARERDLAAWDPQLVAPCLSGLLRVAAAEGQHRGDDLDHAFGQLCLLDPRAAAAFAPVRAIHPAQTQVRR